jgi:hypothetical protein
VREFPGDLAIDDQKTERILIIYGEGSLEYLRNLRRRDRN